MEKTALKDIEADIKALLAKMTTAQKIGQLYQISLGDDITPDIEAAVLAGAVGSFLNVGTVEKANTLQKIAMEKAPIKIPLIIGRDVIHGYRTVFPIPLGQAASFNTNQITQCARYAAIEATACGIRWTFSPMVDIARDPRWGRVAEGAGEDPFVAGTVGKAMLLGYQTNTLTDITAMAGCAKHYVGYGATEGGRDYNTTLIPENTLRDVYLKPFQTLCSAGSLTFMSAFNDLNGEPASGNHFTLTLVLRNEWNFKGFVVSDWESVKELITHGYALDKKDAAYKAFLAGVDMEMVSDCYPTNLQALIDEKKFTMADLETAVANVLRVKFKLDLFKSYYTDPARQSVLLKPEHLLAARVLARESIVMLQNTKSALPLVRKNVKSIALIGPLADDGDNQLGCWAPDGLASDSHTPLAALKEDYFDITVNYAKGLPDCQSTDTSLFADAIAAAQKSDVTVLIIGEDRGMSGEANCRADISLPGAQLQLLTEIRKVAKNVIAVIYAGRPLVLTPVLPLVDGLLYAWHLGTMAGPAICDILFGVVPPSGKLPISFPKHQGQIPLYYNKKNTGRPQISKYLEVDAEPLFPFGFGLSFATFVYSNFSVSKTKIVQNDTFLITATVTNKTNMNAEEVAFLFVRDRVGSFTRPVLEVKGFSKVTCKALMAQTVSFILSTSDLAFFTSKHTTAAEPGFFDIYIGPNSVQMIGGSVELTN